MVLVYGRKGSLGYMANTLTFTSLILWGSGDLRGQIDGCERPCSASSSLAVRQWFAAALQHTPRCLAITTTVGLTPCMDTFRHSCASLTALFENILAQTIHAVRSSVHLPCGYPGMMFHSTS